MSKKISFLETKDKLVITIPSYLSSRAKALFIFYGILMFIPILFICQYLITSFDIHKILPIVVLVGASIMGTFIGHNLLKRVFSKEVIEINNNTLSIINGYFIFLNTKKYKLPLISQIQLSGYNSTPLTNEGNLGIPGYHAMGGFAKASNVDESIEFIYDNILTINFGKNVPSWDAEEVIEKIKHFIPTESQLQDTVVVNINKNKNAAS